MLLAHMGSWNAAVTKAWVELKDMRSKRCLVDYFLPKQQRTAAVYSWALMVVTTYPILAFCLGLEEGTIQAFLQAFSLDRAFPFPLCSWSRWALYCEEELGKLSGLITLGMFFSPLCRAFAIASDIILFAFSCLSCGVESIWWCVLRGTLFSDEELDEDEEEDEEDDDEDELLFIGGLRTRIWLPGPLAFFRGYGQREK